MGFLNELEIAASICSNKLDWDIEAVKKAEDDIHKAHKITSKIVNSEKEEELKEFDVDYGMPIDKKQIFISRTNDQIIICINPITEPNDQGILWDLLKDCIQENNLYNLILLFESKEKTID